MAEKKKKQFHPDAIEDAKQSKIVRDKEIQDRLERAAELGSRCLNNPDFIKYRENYELLEKLLIQSWLDCTEPDPLKYTVEVRGMALKLHQVRLLLEGVKEDTSKKEAKK